MGARTYRTVLIGAGNVASFLKENIIGPFEVLAVGGRSRSHPIPKDADIYIISVSDKAISAVAEELKDVNGLVVHTAGSVPMDVLPQTRRGVFYPLQTISKGLQSNSAQVVQTALAYRDSSFKTYSIIEADIKELGESIKIFDSSYFSWELNKAVLDKDGTAILKGSEDNKNGN